MSRVIRRRALNSLEDKTFVINAVDNPKFMAAIYAAGWSKSPDGITEKECKKVTTVAKTGGSHVAGITGTPVEDFDCFKYFTGLTSIPSSAFKNSTAIGNLTIPEGVKTINGYAVEGCTNLDTLIIPDSVISLGTNCLRGTYAKTIIIGTGVTRIGGGNEILLAVRLNRLVLTGVTTIAGTIVSSTSSLQMTTIELPSTLTSVSKGFLNGVDCLNITIPTNTNFEVLNGGLVNKNTNTLVQGTSITTTIPSSVVAIGQYAFYGNKFLTQCTIPSTVKSIGAYAFDGCSNTEINLVCSEGMTLSATGYQFRNCSKLRSVVLASTCTVVPEYFANTCSNLTSITIPEGVQRINQLAFNKTKLTNGIELPSTISYLGYRCFKETTPPWIIIKAVVPPTLDPKSNVYEPFPLSTSIPIYVPDNSVQAYKDDTNWAKYAGRFVPLSQFNN